MLIRYAGGPPSAATFVRFKSLDVLVIRRTCNLGKIKAPLVLRHNPFATNWTFRMMTPKMPNWKIF
jgi:hypothetical protein